MARSDTPDNPLQQETVDPDGVEALRAPPLRPDTTETTAFDALRPASRGVLPIPTVNIGEEIDHFRVIRQLGQGGMGRVLLARDTQLGRLVALKIIREDRLDRLALGAFLDEARMTARLSHPNIVTIHHIGHWQQSMYLALEYVEGGTLRDRLHGQIVPAREAMRMALPIARALEAAHAANVSHCDLKPENVLVPPDGRLRVVDFGIARVIENRPWDEREAGKANVAGTPGYMAPEQWVGESPTAAVDVWALGVIVYEMLMGHRPFEGPGQDGRPMHLRVLDPQMQPKPLQGVGDDFRQLVVAMLARTPGGRPHAADIVRNLERLLTRDDAGPHAEESPFRGLLPFEERHAAFFFGREMEIDAAVERLRVTTILPIVGPSGAGKSSFVQAGVVARLREQGPQTALLLRPGPHPLTALANRVLATDTLATPAEVRTERESVEALAAQLLARPAHLNVLLHAMADAKRTRVVLIVDQLEEVVTQGCPPEEAQAFLAAVAMAADVVDDQVRVILTLRDDFLSRVAVGDAMTAALNNVFVLRRLDDQLLRDAATRPLTRLGYAWDDPELVNRVVAELHGLASALPLLQFACAALWERRDQRNHLLRRADYEAIGGVAGALAAHAESVFDGLSLAELGVARVLLLRLVAADGARRVVTRTDAIDGLGEPGNLLVERLAQARLLTVRRSRLAANGEAVVELAHDSLLRDWPQLRKWLDESSEERLALAELEDAARVWHGRGRAEREVWPLDAVVAMQRRLRTEANGMSQVARDFLERGQTHGLRDRRRKRWALVGTLALALAISVTSILAAMAFAQKERETKRQADLIQNAAVERSLAAADTGLVDLDVQVFDWDPAQLVARDAPIAAFPDLRVSVWEVDNADAPTSDRARDAEYVHFSAPVRDTNHWRTRLQTRSGPVFLRIDGRGRAGQTCPPSWLKVRRLPGWSARARGPTAFSLRIPSCDASEVDMIVVPGGPVYFGGTGEPPIPSRISVDMERQIDVAPFTIDRTEATNAWFAAFATHQALTSVGLPDYPSNMRDRGLGEPDHPVVAVDALVADAFCAWRGKRLPTTEEWTKAARGGLTLDAAGRVANPMPRRNLPWGNGDPGPRFNLHDAADPWPLSAPVTADTAGASPYGLLAMADNVSEWTSSAPDANQSALRTMRGGDWGSEASDGLHSISVQNQRSPRFFSFSLGFRCAGESGQHASANARP